MSVSTSLSTRALTKRKKSRRDGRSKFGVSECVPGGIEMSRT
jgi:hypothetical protein